MSRVSIRLPDSLHKQLREWASAQGTSIDQLISSAVAEKLAALLSPEYLEARAKAASRKKFRPTRAKKMIVLSSSSVMTPLPKSLRIKRRLNSS